MGNKRNPSTHWKKVITNEIWQLGQALKNANGCLNLYFMDEKNARALALWLKATRTLEDCLSNTDTSIYLKDEGLQDHWDKTAGIGTYNTTMTPCPQRQLNETE